MISLTKVDKTSLALPVNRNTITLRTTGWCEWPSWWIRVVPVMTSKLWLQTRNPDEYCAKNRVQNIKDWPTCRHVCVVLKKKMSSGSFLISVKLCSFRWAMLQCLESMKWWEWWKKWLVLLLRYNTNTYRKKAKKTIFFFAEKPVSWSTFQISTIQTGHKSANHNIATNTES